MDCGLYTITRVGNHDKSERGTFDMIYEVTLHQTYTGENCFNHWNYQCTGTPVGITGSLALATALGAIPVEGEYSVETVIGALSVIQNVGVTFMNLLVRELWDPADFYDVPFLVELVGAATGDGLPPFNAYGFRTTRVRRDIRRGTKRFVGVGETNQSAGVLSGGITALMDQVALLMTAAPTFTNEGNNLVFIPTICGKERYNPDTQVASPTGRAYRYYADEATQSEHVAQNFVWERYDTIRPQSSRVVGHGT